MTKPKTLAKCKELEGRITLHNILCIEADISDCEEACRVEGLIRKFYGERLDKLEVLYGEGESYWIYQKAIEDAKGVL